MCFNCGCAMPNNDMGKSKISQGGGSLTEDDFKNMADKWGISIEETKKNTFDVLKKQFEK